MKRKIIKKILKLSDFQLEKLEMMVAQNRRALRAAQNPKLEALLLSHSLEKGMSLNNPRENFGEDKAKNLLRSLETIDGDCFEYNVAMSILAEYFKANNSQTEEFAKIRKEYEKLKKDRPFKRLPAGFSFAKRQDLLKCTKINFEDFVASRHDIRKTANEKIKEAEIKKVIEIAGLAPSACNRQPWKIYYSLDEKKNKELGNIVSGNKTFAGDMKYYCAIVLDHTYFANRPDEFNQIYLNAGIMTAYLALAFHSVGIGSCIMQFTGLVEDADAKSRKILGIKDSEQVMVVIGYGKYPEQVKYSLAARKTFDEISQKF